MNTKSLGNLRSLIYEEVRKAKTALKEDKFGSIAPIDKNKTLLIAKMVADAISKTDNVKATVNMNTLDVASFDIDLPNDETAGGSYNLYADGSIRNMALPEAPIYGNWKTDDANKMAVIIKGLSEVKIKTIKEARIKSGRVIKESFEIGSRVKVIGQGLEDQNKTGEITDIAPGGKFYTVKIQNKSAYFHESDLKVLG